MSDRTIHNNRSGEDLAVCLIHTSRRRNTFHTPLRWLVYTEVLNPSVLRSSWCKALSTPAVTPGCQRHHQRHLSQLWPNHCHRHHHHHRCDQATISWRASGDRQISLSASAERAFANFRDKNTSYFTITNFATKYCSFLQLHENKHFHGAGVDSPALALANLR